MQDIEEIYEKHFKTVYRYLFCLTHNKDVAEELTQETFYRAVKNIHKFKGNCKISVWLCQIAKNLWYDECLKQKRFAIDFPEHIEDDTNLEDFVIANVEKNSLYKKLQLLDPVTRDVIYLRISRRIKF